MPGKYQSVRVKVTIGAAVEFIQHSFAVRQTVAVLTLRDIAVGFLMAIGALQAGVLFVCADQP